MKLIILFLTLMSIFNCFADEVKLEVLPPKPVAGETFQVFFRIFTDSSETPVINFNPKGLEVAGKSNQGTSVRTIYSNGTLTTTREVTIVYELTASKAGFASLDNITVDLGSRSIRHPSLNLNILKEAEEIQDVFLMADVPKRSIYLGEGFVVRYFLYTKVQTNNPDVKRYPKLNKFLKRFLQEPERSERVSVNGHIYVRYQIYAAKLFPEKVGTLKIDSLELSVRYSSMRSNDPFGNFGFNRNLRNKSLVSEVIKIEVKPLPEAGKPQNFTGLVGKHEFDLQMGQSRLIVNEPLEVKLTVTGVGALENLDAPVLIKHPGLEEFESNGDLKIMNADQATKVFDYTFLAKENLKLPAQQISMSYFDPNTEKYVITPISIPEIVVAGGLAATKSPETVGASKIPLKGPAPKPEAVDYAKPLADNFAGWRSWLPYINLSLAAFSILIAMGWFIRYKSFPRLNTKTYIPTSFKKNEFKMTEFGLWITPLIEQTGGSPLSVLQHSKVSEETKKYFIDLIDASDYKDYSTHKTDRKYVYSAKAFKELAQYIEKVKNEDSKIITRYS